MTIGQRIRNRRKQLGMSADELALKLGKDRSTIFRYEKDEIKGMPYEIIKPIAAALGMDYIDLISPENGDIVESQPTNLIPLHVQKIPVLGTIAAGSPILATENFDEYISPYGYVKCDFALRIKGESMSGLNLHTGDIVFIKHQDSVEDGQVAAVLIGEEATLKRFYRIDNGVSLVSENPSFHPLIYVGDDCESIRVIGLAVAYLKELR